MKDGADRCIQVQIQKWTSRLVIICHLSDHRPSSVYTYINSHVYLMSVCAVLSQLTLNVNVNVNVDLYGA